MARQARDTSMITDCGKPMIIGPVPVLRNDTSHSPYCRALLCVFTSIKIRVGYLPHFNGYRVRAEAYRRATVPGSVAIAVRVQMRSRTGRAGPVGWGKFPGSFGCLPARPRRGVRLAACISAVGWSSSARAACSILRRSRSWQRAAAAAWRCAASSVFRAASAGSALGYLARLTGAGAACQRLAATLEPNATSPRPTA